MAEFNGTFGSNRAGTWVENGIGSNRTKKPKAKKTPGPAKTTNKKTKKKVGK